MKSSAAAVAGTALAKAASPSLGVAGANQRLAVGIIGVGGQACAHIRALGEQKDIAIAAMCDIDANRLAAAAMMPGSSPRMFGDYRKLLDMKDLDAVLVATPDHWHAIITIAALDAGKHVYFEKPSGHNIREGRLMADAAKRSGKVALIGTQQRSGRHWQNAVARIQAGELGKINMVHAWNAWNRQEMFGSIGKPKDSPVPGGVDYDTWLGPAPRRPFNPARFHTTWYYFWDYSGGMICMWGVHLFDAVQWVMGPEIRSVSATGGHFVFNDCRDTPDTAAAVFECPGYTLTYSIRHGNGWRPHGDYDHGIEFFGDKGTLQINRHGYQLYRDQDRASRKPFHEEPQIDDALFEHQRHFFDCIREGAKPRCDALTGHLSSIPGHLINIAYRTGRKVRWDAQAEQIIDDPEAAKLLSREYRAPWHV